MAKYVKLIVEDDVNMKHVMSLTRKFASANFKKSTIYAWDTERTDDTYTVSFPEPTFCGRLVGKSMGKDLVCGADGYVCPTCK